MKSDIVFVIVSYNPEKVAFRSLLLTLSPYPVMIVDNGGTPISRSTNVEVITPENNAGYGGGANVGIERAVSAGASWVVIVNQDVELTKDAVEKFVALLEHTEPGIVGPFVGSLEPKRWSTMLGKKGDIPYISGAFFAIHREVVEKIGYFYEPYFMYYEDADYCMRAKKAGFPLIGRSIAGIRHEDSPSLGKGSHLHEYYLSRNHLLFVEREAPFAVKLYELLRLPKTISEYKKAGNRGGSDGVKDYFLRRFGEKKL